MSFSGGKDSTVLADIAAQWCKVAGIPLTLCFVDTGLEFPEVKEHVREYADWLRDKHKIDIILDILHPKMVFSEVIRKFGYPIISKGVSQKVYGARKGWGWDLKFFNSNDDKYGTGSMYNLCKWSDLLHTDFHISNQCCNVMKKYPDKKYRKQTGSMPITGSMASESTIRKTAWLSHGCNGFDMANPISNPMSFWTDQDVLQYIKKYDIPMASVYGEIVPAGGTQKLSTPCDKLCTTGCARTGCVFCAYGAHLEKGEGRFERLKRTHPKLWNYCIYGGAHDPEDGIWRPTKEGLGMGYVFDQLNDIYGKDFIQYGKE